MGYKTSDTIEAQEERKRAKNGRDQTDFHDSAQASVRQKLPKYDASRLKQWQYKKGQSGNPGGKPKVDLAAHIARMVFEQNEEAVFKALTKALLKGNGYVFKELADRGYGRLKEKVEVDIPYKDVPIEDLEQQVKRLEIRLGYRKAEEELPPVSSESKPN